MKKNHHQNELDSDPRIVEVMRNYKSGDINLETALFEMQNLTGLSAVVCKVFLSAITRKNVISMK